MQLLQVFPLMLELNLACFSYQKLQWLSSYITDRSFHCHHGSWALLISCFLQFGNHVSSRCIFMGCCRHYDYHCPSAGTYFCKNSDGSYLPVLFLILHNRYYSAITLSINLWANLRAKEKDRIYQLSIWYDFCLFILVFLFLSFYFFNFAWWTPHLGGSASRCFHNLRMFSLLRITRWQ